jgi:hypothetical protein
MDERSQQDLDYLLALSEDQRRQAVQVAVRAQEEELRGAEARLQAEKADLQQVRAKRLAALSMKQQQQQQSTVMDPLMPFFLNPN